MGQSTDAILAFGFDLGEELPDALMAADGGDDGFDWEAVVASIAGIVHPTDEYGEETKPQYAAYWRAKSDAAKAHALDLIHHCSGDYAMYFLAVNGTERRARRGAPVPVEMPPIDPSRIEAMREFCAKFGIVLQEPKWHIFSVWN